MSKKGDYYPKTRNSDRVEPSLYRPRLFGPDGRPLTPARTAEPEDLPPWQQDMLAAFPDQEEALSRIEVILGAFGPDAWARVAEKVMRYEAAEGWQQRIASQPRNGMAREASE